jgi:hypothetical protein
MTYLGIENNEYSIIEWTGSFGELIDAFPECVWYDVFKNRNELELFREILEKDRIGEIWY